MLSVKATIANGEPFGDRIALIDHLMMLNLQTVYLDELSLFFRPRVDVERVDVVLAALEVVLAFAAVLAAGFAVAFAAVLAAGFAAVLAAGFAAAFVALALCSASVFVVRRFRAGGASGAGASGAGGALSRGATAIGASAFLAAVRVPRGLRARLVLEPPSFSRLAVAK